MDHVFETDLTGVVHVYGETLSKYDTIRTANDLYWWQKEIVPVDEPEIYRTLSSYRKVDLPSMTLAEMIHIMRQKEDRVWNYLSKYQLLSR